MSKDSRRDDRTLWLERGEAKWDFFRPDGTFLILGGPAMNRWAIFGRPSGTSAREKPARAYE